jgi:ornithine carbamoyltransferase
VTAIDIPAISHLLAVRDLDARQLDALLDLAATMKRHPLAWHTTLVGHSVACLFAEPSTRTRVSFEAAIFRLGGLPIMLRPDELHLDRGEPIADTARVLSSYCDAIVVRMFAQRDVAELAEYSSAPVINALTNAHDPCQAIADCLTLREHFGSLDGLQVAYVGDGNNVAHSLIEAAALAGIELRIASPPGRQADPAILMGAGSSVRIEADPREAVRGAHAVYTGAWVSIGHQAVPDRRREQLSTFAVTPELMALAHHDAVFLHCLPARRGEEVDAAVIDGPASLVWRQAANRLPTEQALLYAIVTGDWEA